MRRPRIPSVVVVALLALLCTIAVRAQTGTPDSDSFPDANDHFRYGSIGTEENVGLPYWIWKVLPTVFEDKLPKRPGTGYERIGFLMDSKRHARPIGTSYLSGRVARVGLNCATCHVGTYRETPTSPPQLVSGMPANHMDLQGYANFLTACANDPRFNYGTLMTAIRKENPDIGFFERLIYKLFVVGATKKGILERARDNAWFDRRPPFGPGRVDTFNPYKVILKLPIDDVVGTVDLPSLWNQRMRARMWLHWDGNNDSVEERNKSAAIGAGASPDSLNLESMKRIENWILDLKPPPYPAARIDKARAGEGRRVWEQACASCHSVESPLVGQVTSLGNVGTDPERLNSFTPELARGMNTIGEGKPWRFNHFRKTNGYANMPLDGLWLRAPYLHNGSVPTLRALLFPDERPAVFYRGYDVFDWANVGFISSGPEAEAGGVRFDTSLRGNSNAGHVYGATLSRQERELLLEYPEDAMSARLILRAVVACWCALLLACATGGMRPESLPKFENVEEQFKYGSIGVESEQGIPYWIWQVLPRVFADKLPRPGGYAAFGFQWEPGKELPVGFSKADLFGGPRVAVNCAFCHTASVRTSELEPPRIIAAGPGNQINPQAYVKFLQAVAEDPRFDSDELLTAIAGITKLSWRQRMQYRFLLIPAARRALKKQRREYDWMYKNPEWGPGRVDPFNPVKFGILKLPVDPTIGNSDMVPIFNMKARQGMSLHWDGLSASLREVVLSSALGDGASRKSIPLASLARIEQWLMEVQPPAYPYDVDKALAGEGRVLYEQQCAQCHAAGGKRTGTVVPVEEVGTDRHRLDMWTPAAPVAYNRFAEGYPWAFTGFKKTGGYVTMPLDGVWLRAPYLHNGSVPSLQELFEPVAARRSTFYRGYNVFDPARVGFVSEGEAATRTGMLYDTRLPGNSNAGHLYGTELTPAQKKALIEYLKTL